MPYYRVHITKASRRSKWAVGFIAAVSLGSASATDGHEVNEQPNNP